MTKRVRIGLVVALVLGAFPREASAEGRTSALSWVRLPGAEGCINAVALASAVEKRLGHRVFVPPTDADLSVEGSIAYRSDSKRFAARFRVADRSGTELGVRDLEESASSCDQLDERLTFVLSVLIDPEAAFASPAAAVPASPPAPEPGPTIAPPPAPRVVHPVVPKEPWRWLVGADFGGGTGIVPNVGWVVSVGALVTPPGWPGLRASGSSFLPASQRIEGIASAQIELVTGELGICPLQVRRPPFGLNACIGGSLGELSAQGAGFPASRPYGTLLASIALDTVAELAVTHGVLITLSPKLIVPLTRARLAYEDSGGQLRTIFEVAPVGGAVALGLALGHR